MLNKITIKGIVFDIKLEDLGAEYFGDYNELNKIIRINSKASSEFQEMTLIHEIIHLVAKDIEESIVEKLAWDLWNVLKDNNLLKI